MPRMPSHPPTRPRTPRRFLERAALGYNSTKRVLVYTMLGGEFDSGWKAYFTPYSVGLNEKYCDRCGGGAPSGELRVEGGYRGGG
jgi:hypothetical protein